MTLNYYGFESGYQWGLNWEAKRLPGWNKNVYLFTGFGGTAVIVNFRHGEYGLNIQGDLSNPWYVETTQSNNTG